MSLLTGLKIVMCPKTIMLNPQNISCRRVGETGWLQNPVLRPGKCVMKIRKDAKAIGFWLGGHFGGIKLIFEVYFHHKNMSLIYGWKVWWYKLCLVVVWSLLSSTWICLVGEFLLSTMVNMKTTIWDIFPIILWTSKSWYYFHYLWLKSQGVWVETSM